MATKKQLQATMRKAQAELWEIERKERIKALRSRVGKCFKYRNCYSCPKDESERWWLYAAVLSIDKDGYLETIQFQTDKDGRLDIKRDTQFGDMAGNWFLISRHEFDAALADFLADAGQLAHATGYSEDAGA